jgi:hypothetical protein
MDALSDILAILQQVNGNVQQLLLTKAGIRQSQQPPTQPNYIGHGLGDFHTSFSRNVELQPCTSSSDDITLAVPYRHSTAAHQLLQWPFMRRTLERLPFSPNIITPFRSGIDWFLYQHRGRSNNELSCTVSLPAAATEQPGTLLGIPYTNVFMWANLYFDTFNFMHPLLDRAIFFPKCTTTSGSYRWQNQLLQQTRKVSPWR